jgi:hypothetical protein
MIDIQDDHGRGGGGPATLATVRVLDCEPQRSSLALPFSEIGWNAFSKNRVKPAAAA